MAYFRKLNGQDMAGFDESRYMQVISIGKTSSVYLVAGGDMDIFTDDDDIATVKADAGDNKRAHVNGGLDSWEKSQNLRIVIKAVCPGTTKLRAQINGCDWSNPLNITVVADQNGRRVGAYVSPDARQAIQGASLRDAVMIVAEDQMNSAIGRGQTGEKGASYSGNGNEEWCGDFIYWCWKQAAAIQSATNPLGGSNPIRSTIKAISSALRPETPGVLLRYEGGDSYAVNKNYQQWLDIGYNGYNLEPGDIILHRNIGHNTFFHLSMVYSTDGGLKTIQGNAGSPPINIKALSKFQPVAATKSNMSAYAFIHLIV